MIKFLILTVLLIAPHVYAALEISAPETNHTVAFPLERNFRFVLKISNAGDRDEIISAVSGGPQEGRDWINIFPSGRWKIAPGETAEIVATFEPVPAQGKHEDELRYDFTLEADGFKSIPLTIKYRDLNWRSFPREKIRINVVDKSTLRPVENAQIFLSLPSGLEGVQERTDSRGFSELRAPSTEYLDGLYREYSIATSYTGYFLEVSKEGYMPYYQSEVRAPSELKISLEPHTEYFEFKKLAEKQTEFSIWWIRASKDFKYIATSAGMHPNPDIKPPKEVAVYLFNEKGEQLWRYPISAEKARDVDLCWGLDAASDGSYVAAGCFDGSVYLLNRKGELVKKFQANGAVRWIKFSPDDQYLAFGPTEKGADYFGAYEIPAGTLVRESFVGDHTRTVAFSPDGSLAAGSSNGALNFFDPKGRKLWQGSNGGLVPFLIGFDAEGKKIATGGKGRNLVVHSTNGEVLWNRIIDQTITAGSVGENGEISVGTVGGTVYYFKPDGSLSFRKFYGGVGHNGVYMTRNGKYLIAGGTNPTLFDNNGTVLWRFGKEESGRMYSAKEQVNGVNVALISEDGSRLVLGYDSGKLEFYEGRLVSRAPPGVEREMAPETTAPFATTHKTPAETPTPGKRICGPAALLLIAVAPVSVKMLLRRMALKILSAPGGI